MDNLLKVVLIISCFVNINEGCICKSWGIHPQDQYCGSEYAVKVLTLSHKYVKVFQDGNVKYLKTFPDFQVEYEVDVIKTYKGNVKDGVKNKIYSLLGTSCSVTLELGRIYFIVGKFNSDRNMEIGQCNLIFDGSNPNTRSILIEENFEKNWKKGCQNCRFCNKDLKHITCDENEKNTCIWYPEKANISSSLTYCSNEGSGFCDIHEAGKANSNKIDKVYFFILFALASFIGLF